MYKFSIDRMQLGKDRFFGLKRTEENRREYFRSALELIKLIDSALDEQKMDNAFEQHTNERSEEHVS